MGATTFFTEAIGGNAQHAFACAVDDARYDYGHRGYTGTIAEKNSFVMIKVPEGKDPYDFAHDLIKAKDPRVDDKWGPAGCIELSATRFMFFGWASE